MFIKFFNANSFPIGRGPLAEGGRHDCGKIQCVDCGNNYASKNTLRVHRTAYCLKRNTPAAKKALQRFDKVCR